MVILPTATTTAANSTTTTTTVDHVGSVCLACCFLRCVSMIMSRYRSMLVTQNHHHRNHNPTIYLHLRPVCQLQKMIGARTLAVARRLYAAQARTSSGRAVARAVGASQQQQQQWRTRRAAAGEGSCHRPRYCIVLQLLTQAATVACVLFIRLLSCI